MSTTIESNKVTPSRELLRSAGASAYILALARSIPCLEHKLAQWDRWDALEFRRCSRSWCHGEIVCANFVLTVWNYNEAKRSKRLFDFCDARSVIAADDEAWRVILDWWKEPVWP